MGGKQLNKEHHCIIGRSKHRTWTFPEEGKGKMSLPSLKYQELIYILGQGSLEGCSSWGRKDSDMMSDTSLRLR